MATPSRRTISDTDSSINIEVPVDGTQTVDEMEVLLGSVASDLGLHFSHITKLGAKRYPGNRHWHLKQDPQAKGCLDVTYWPDGPLLWITVRRSEPAWVHEAGRALGPALEHDLGSEAEND